jgi:phage repressor protein C with HTH and peptisase S24 domain
VSYPRIIERLQKGEKVALNPSGNSMTPLINSKDRIVLAALDREVVKGDVVLAKVKGRYYIHLVTAVGDDGRVQISNNHGHVNGWTRNVYGRVVEIG